MKIFKLLISLMAIAAMSVSCLTGIGSDDAPDPNPDPDPDPGTGTLSISVSSTVIQSDGTDVAQIEVRFNDTVVTEGVDIYDAKTNKILDLPSMRFTTTTPGTYSFWAAYRTEHTAAISIEAVDMEIPARAEDAQPANTAFVRRVLLTQFTGTGCGYCPFMVNLLRTVLAEPAYSSSVVLAAAHLYNREDPAYLSTAHLNQAMGVFDFPAVVVDMQTRFDNYNLQSVLEKTLSSAIARTTAKAGISVSSELSGNTLVVRVSVKAAETGEYRVGAWLLEDGIYAVQTNNGADGEFNTHDNCIRIADSRVTSTNYTGISLGTVEKGKIADHLFVMTLDSKWVQSNCRLVVFVSSLESSSFYVNNVIKAPLTGQVAFEYE